MKPIKITTDTASDISLETAEKYGIHLMPINLTIDGRQCKDRYDIDPVEFLELLPKCAEIPKTSQVTVIEHMEEFKKLKDDYTIIHVSLSGNASGTNQSARLAAEEIMEEDSEADITVLDSMSFSYGYGMYVIEAAQMAMDGKSKEDIISTLTDRFQNCRIYFATDTLEYLKKGGRISAASKVIADVLDISPILTIEDGLVVSKSKVRGKKKIPAVITDMVAQSIDKDKTLSIGLIHANDPVISNKVIDLLKEKTGIESYCVELLGPTIGIHAGPGAWGVIFQEKKL
jgi:DegV family protein with EDD domain